MKKTISIVHHDIKPNGRGGIGVLATHTTGDSFICVSTSVCSIDDQYVKKVANTMLKDSYESGKFIKLPIQNDVRYKMNHRYLRNVVMDIIPYYRYYG